MNHFQEKPNWLPRKTSEQRREELLAFAPSGDEATDLLKIVEITGVQPLAYQEISKMKLADFLMRLQIIKTKFTAEREVTPEEEDKLEEIIEFYRLKGGELVGGYK